MNDRERIVDEKLLEIVTASFVEQDRVLALLTPFHTAKYLEEHGVTVQKHGRWVGLEYDGFADGCPVYDVWECSECGEEIRGEDAPDTHDYCPNCGAKMDGEADEHN